jgi:peptide deformylase
MDTLPVLKDPAPSLRERSIEVTPAEITTSAFQQYLDVLTRTMFVEDGIGIASPQVGKNIRVIIVNLKKEGATAFINPVLTKVSESTTLFDEACLSVPGKYGIVRRHKRVTMQALNRHGRQVQMEVSGLFAYVFQHEIDHLDGVLYIDRAVEVFDKHTGRKIHP